MRLSSKSGLFRFVGYRMLFFLLVCPPVSSPVLAQSVEIDQDPARQVHWAMGAFFGTGWYQVEKNRTMYIFRVMPRQTLDDPEYFSNTPRVTALEIRYPVTFGLHKLDDIPDFIEFENYGSISFTPGVQLDIPINEKWALRPFAHLGAGYEQESDEWAAIWYGGLKSRYLLGESPKLRWSLLNALYYAGYKPEYKSRGRFGAIMTGLEFSQPIKGWTFAGEPLRLNSYLTYSYLFDKLNFHIDDFRTESVQDQWEIGLALGHNSRKMKLWFMKFDQIGLSYKISSNGVYRAISLNLRSPFAE